MNCFAGGSQVRRYPAEGTPEESGAEGAEDVVTIPFGTGDLDRPLGIATWLLRTTVLRLGLAPLHVALQSGRIDTLFHLLVLVGKIAPFKLGAMERCAIAPKQRRISRIG